MRMHILKVEKKSHISGFDLKYQDTSGSKVSFIFSDIVASTVYTAIQIFSNGIVIHSTTDVLQLFAIVRHVKDLHVETWASSRPALSSRRARGGLSGRPCTRSTASPLGRPTGTQRMLTSISVHLAQPIVHVVQRSLREFDQKKHVRLCSKSVRGGRQRKASRPRYGSVIKEKCRTTYVVPLFLSGYVTNV